MKKGPQSHSEQARQSLLDLWRGDPGFGNSIGCIATTFTFDAAFFEEHCLTRFIGVESNPNETAKAYFIEREEKLSQNFACVLVDASQVSFDRSLRWHQLSVELPLAGSQHSKLTILAWDLHVRVLVASANLTEAAYRMNQEQVAVLEFNDAGADPALLKECIDFARAVSGLVRGAGSTEGPHKALRDFLDTVERKSTEFRAGENSEARCFLVPLLRGSRTTPVLEQLRTRWNGPAPNESWVTSPFYDEGADAAATAKNLAGLLTTRGERSIEFSAIGRRLPSGAIEVDAPAELIPASHPSLTHTFKFINEAVSENGDVVRRPLHAKAFWLQRDSSFMYMVGSSNFTRAGLGLHPRHNIELNVAYAVSDATSKFASLCRASWIEGENVPNPASAQFLGSPHTSDEPALAHVRLHSAFGAALLRIGANLTVLDLEISRDAPTTFELLDGSRSVISTSQRWIDAGHPGIFHIEWTNPKLPSALLVRWQSESEWREAAWIINVVDPSTLPSAEELSGLTLDELIAVLTSARPLHELVMKMIEQRTLRSGQASHTPVVTTAEYSTQHFILKRMRRASDAFEGIRRRLESPLHSLESLRWRLHGPVGPLALAEKLSTAEGAAAGFMIAELAATIAEVKWQHGKLMEPEVVQSEARKIIARLRELAEINPSNEDLTAHVEKTFREIAI